MRDTESKKMLHIIVSVKTYQIRSQHTIQQFTAPWDKPE